MGDDNMSVSLYKYLCSKLGHENDVKTRRLCYTMSEYLGPYNTTIPSGSKAEGLDFTESDVDIMFLLTYVHVYEHQTNSMSIDTFIISTEDTAPGYVRLISYGYTTPLIRKWCLKQDRNKLLLSNKLLKENWLSNFPYVAFIHGPCITDPNKSVDHAFCFRCTSWIQQAQPWIQRKREWPSANLIHKIKNYGVLFVAIGCTDSPNEETEWRVSFSVAEKQLIYSFSHSQLLCYALMKILLKEVIDTNQFYKDQLCSYFMKTVVLWASEELPVHVWKPANIIFCFQYVIQRLIYFIRIEFLPHYFISDNNILKHKLTVVQLTSILNLLVEFNYRGIYCLSQSRTMSKFFQSNYVQRTLPANPAIEQMYSQLKIFLFNSLFKTKQHVATLDMLFRLIDSYKLKSHKFLYSTLTAMVAKHISGRGTNIWELNNKYFYKRHKNKLPYLLIGLQSDALSGWLNLATYFYCMKQYQLSFYLTVFTLRKCLSNEIICFQCMDVGFNRILTNVEHEALEYGFINAFHVCKRHLTDNVEFSVFSCIFPLELEMEIRMRIAVSKSPILYGFFLRFLCLHHLNEHTDVLYALQDLYDLRNYVSFGLNLIDWNICIGQAHYTLGNFQMALTFFNNVPELEEQLSLFACVKPLKYKTFATFMINHIQLKL
ncbi:Hypothetical predicted protein [Mytilus galloprovincialis]|uniref:Mab-21-like HhH/H2TH-like domain-containing protein n=1 Tax=Mytilus galloprovincialis TaxID=29158 RepID=A0A8B6E2L7_MYTGA|nr:Hypothetical predicted protein [Mytilus galloprovincialis]